MKQNNIFLIFFVFLLISCSSKEQLIKSNTSTPVLQKSLRQAFHTKKKRQKRKKKYQKSRWNKKFSKKYFRRRTVNRYKKKISLKQKKRQKRRRQKRVAKSLFQKSRRTFFLLNFRGKHHLTWKEVRRGIYNLQRYQKISSQEAKSTLKLIQFFINQRRKVGTIFHTPFQYQGVHSIPKKLIWVDQGWILPEMKSMWEHVKAEFYQKFPKYSLKIIAGYQTPAYQLYQVSQHSGKLVDVLKNIPPPYYSFHSKSIPSITVDAFVGGKSAILSREYLAFRKIAQKYGFYSFAKKQQSYLTSGDFYFIGLKKLYQKVLSSKRVPSQFSKEFFAAMKQQEFYPSPEGLAIIFALSYKEASFQWNPRLNGKKKKEVKAKFYQNFAKITDGVGGFISNLFLSKSFKKEKKQVEKELLRITNLKNYKITEYDLYQWSQKTYRFFQGFIKKNQKVVNLGSFFFNVQEALQRLEKEPQTFGLWQINVNHFVDRLENQTFVQKKFPEFLIPKTKKVDRHGLVQALSGVHQKISHQKTLALIIQAYLKPRYQNHLQGNSSDFHFFIAENLGGEMSTYRAPIQKQLNEEFKQLPHLAVDGDLAIYHPYSIKINWMKTSNTQKRLLYFINQNLTLFERDFYPKDLIQALCLADSWKKLKKSKLYLAIMKNRAGLRSYPQIKSSLYSQSPKNYVGKVLKIIQKF
jgi:hypothetical protein